MEYSGAEIRGGPARRGGGDEEEVDDETPSSREWLPREVLAYPPLLELPREQIMRIKQKLDAQAKSDAIELGMQYPEPDEDNEVIEKLRAARPPEIVRRKHPELKTEFDPVKVVRQAERDRLEKVSLEYREKERFLRPSRVKEDVVGLCRGGRAAQVAQQTLETAAAAGSEEGVPLPHRPAGLFADTSHARGHLEETGAVG